MLGNEDSDGQNCLCQPVTWKWDTVGWQQVATSPLVDTAVYDPDLAAVVALQIDNRMDGGNDNLYEWSGGAWKALGSVPTSINYDPHLVYDTARKQLVLLLLGGQSSNTYVYSGSGWSGLGQPGPGFSDDGVAGYDPVSGGILVKDQCSAFGGPCGSPWIWKDGAWTRITTSVTPPVAPALVTDDPTGLVMVFNGGGPDSAWRWTGSDWQALDYANAPSGYGSLTFDASVGGLRLVISNDQGSPTTTWVVENGAWKQVA